MVTLTHGIPWSMPLRDASALEGRIGKTSEKVVITSSYDGETCTSSTGEKIRLACIDTPELRGKRADTVPAKEARDHLRELVVSRQVAIRRITTDRYLSLIHI